MAKFVKKILLFMLVFILASAVVVAFDCFVVGSQYKQNYQASILDKIERIESIDEPKIILIGHSNLSFGMNSQILEEAIGMPVVNLGLHGGLGNAFHEEMARQYVREGDIVVICHSTYSDDDALVDPSLVWVTYDYNPQVTQFIREKDYLQLIKAYPYYLRSSYMLWLRGAGNEDEGTSYSRNSFNEYGDIVYKPEEGHIADNSFFAGAWVEFPGINDTCTDRLNELNRYITGQGASMVVAGYPIAYGEYSDFTEEDFADFQMRLDEELDCDIISDFTDYFFPYEYFYDTVLHLTAEGADARTAQLISDIENWLGQANTLEEPVEISGEEESN